MSKESVDLQTLLNSNQFIVPSYEHYGGLSGFQDYGLLGSVVKNRLIQLWRQEFIQDQIYEVDTPSLVPYDVLKASGHVDRFTDPVVTDAKSNVYRADHLIKAYLKDHPEMDINVDNLSYEEMRVLILNHKLIDIADPTKFEIKAENLMFATQDRTYLRPELAQGIFVNFHQYYNYLKQLPFGVAQVGRSYRKEVSPKPLLRMREFTQAEIEYFFNPTESTSTATQSYLDQYTDIRLPLWTASAQLNSEPSRSCSLEEALIPEGSTYVGHPLMGYFLLRIYQFAIKCGLKTDRMRLREHLPTEKAHYSASCWDLECLIEGDWIECVGCSYRQDYDLKAHRLPLKGNPRQVQTLRKIKRDIIGKRHGKDAKVICDYLNRIKTVPDRTQLDTVIHNFTEQGHTSLLRNDGQPEISIQSDCVEIGTETVYDDYYAHVIEPSFGIDRLMYAIFDHSLQTRETTLGEVRSIVSLPSYLAPYDVGVLQLSNKPELLAVVEELRQSVIKQGLKCFTDLSNTAIGRRYVRTDRSGIPFVFTVDFQSLEDNTVTIRQRDDMSQRRVAIADLLANCRDYLT